MDIEETQIHAARTRGTQSERRAVPCAAVTTKSTQGEFSTSAQWWSHEDKIRVTSIPQYVPPAPDGRRISKAATFRWTTRGLRGVRLRRFKIGGAWHTTLQELDRWSALLTAEAEAGAVA